jgi:hypothetical protein
LNCSSRCNLFLDYKLSHRASFLEIWKNISLRIILFPANCSIYFIGFCTKKKRVGKLCCISSHKLVRMVYALVKRCIKTWYYCGCSLINHLFVIYFNVTASNLANISNIASSGRIISDNCKSEKRRYSDLSPRNLLSPTFTCKDYKNQKKICQNNRFLGQNFKPIR